LEPPSCGGVFQFVIGVVRSISGIAGCEVNVDITEKNAHEFEASLQCHVLVKLSFKGKLLETPSLIASDDKTKEPSWLVYPFPAIRDNYQPHCKSFICSIIHDLQHIDLPKCFSPSDRWKRDKAFSRAVRCSNLVATISDFSARQISKHFQIQSDRIGVIYSGSSMPILHGSKVLDTQDFVLYPANTWPHKNHINLFEAFKILRRRNPELRLILTGDPPREKALKKQLSAFGSVEHLGYVTQERLHELMATAKCLVFPSTYEGFGMPVIEALQAGTPVACSNTTSLPEVGGQAAEYFDPNDPAQIADAVERAIHNRHKPGWVDTARKQAAQFTFERTANLLLHAMQEVSSRGSDPDIERRCLTHPRLSEYWEHFPSLDAVLLPCCCQDLDHVTPDEFKALSNLDMARLNPQNLGSLFVRGDRVSIDSSPSPLAPEIYRKTLSLVAERKLVVFLPCKTGPENNGEISRCLALKVLFWQLTILRRTCRETVLSIITGVWSHTRI